MESSTYKILKYTLFVFGLLVLLIGIGLIAIGIRGLTDEGAYSNLFGTTNSLLVEASSITIAAGCVVIIVGLIGCYGAKADSKVYLGMFFTLMLMLIVLQISAIVIAFVFDANTDRYIRPIAQESISSNYATNSAAGHLVSSGWDILQRTFDCCGYVNGSDYIGSVFDAINMNGQPWPASCCAQNALGGYIDLASCTNDDPSTALGSNASRGCRDSLLNSIREYAVVIGISAACFVGVQFIAMVISCCLFSHADELA